MTEKQDRLEQYEDGLFALMMDCVAEEEGCRAVDLNQRLKEDPEAAVPEAVRKRGEKAIRKAFFSQRRSRASRGLWKGVQTAAVVVLLVAATLTFSMAGFPDLKASVFNMVLNTLEDHTEFAFVSERGADPAYAVEVGWLPEDFEMEEEGSNLTGSWKYYKNAEGATIFIEKSAPIDTSIDTEDAQIEEISIQGNAGTLIVKDGEARVIWLDRDQGVTYFVNTERLSVDTLLKIAENLS